MKLLQLPRCLFGVHERDRRRAWYDGPFIRSQCKGCGKPMIKDGLGWHIETAAAEAATTSD
jgi:hypothetical protein